MRDFRLAVISDIHSNNLALEAVLSDCKSRGVDDVINLGDSLYGPMEPLRTYELLQENNILSISGNQDRFIKENWNCVSEFKTLEFVKSKLKNDAFEWLNKLSFDILYKDQIYCCHATPNNDSVYLLENLQNDYVGIKTAHQLDELLEGIEQGIVVCGHSHLPRIVKTANKLIVNPGSVGLPAYDDELPIPHKMENYNPMAKYSVLTMGDGQFTVDQLAVNYDFEKSAHTAEINGREDWAKWIRTGRV